MAELANSLLMDLSATRHSLGPLIRDRLVRLWVDAKDRRVKRVTLTPTGVAKFKEANQLWRKAQDRFERALSPARAAMRSSISSVTRHEIKRGEIMNFFESKSGSHEKNVDAARLRLPQSLVVDQRGPVTLLKLSRPAKRNALDDATIAGIEAFFTDPPEGTRAIIMHGEGKHFSAGADLAWLVDSRVFESILFSRAAHRAFDRIENADVPVIAVLQGGVIGGGLELAAAAHLRVAERSAYYALPEGSRGIFVGGGGAVRVPRLIGTSRMVDMMLTGRTYGAEEGVALGFSQYLVDDGQGLAKAAELADRIATNTTLSNFAMVQALPRIARGGSDGFLMESLMASIAIGDDAAQARINAFLEKRGPKITPLSGRVA